MGSTEFWKRLKSWSQHGWTRFRTMAQALREAAVGIPDNKPPVFVVDCGTMFHHLWSRANHKARKLLPTEPTMTTKFQTAYANAHRRLLRQAQHALKRAGPARAIWIWIADSLVKRPRHKRKTFFKRRKPTFATGNAGSQTRPFLTHWPDDCDLIVARHETDMELNATLQALGYSADQTRALTRDSDWAIGVDGKFASMFIYPSMSGRALANAPCHIVDMNTIATGLNRRQMLTASTLVGNDGYEGIGMTWSDVLEDVELLEGVTVRDILALPPTLVGQSLIRHGWLERVSAKNRQESHRRLKGLTYHLLRQHQVWDSPDAPTFHIGPQSNEQPEPTPLVREGQLPRSRERWPAAELADNERAGGGRRGVRGLRSKQRHESQQIGHQQPGPKGAAHKGEYQGEVYELDCRHEPVPCDLEDERGWITDEEDEDEAEGDVSDSESEGAEGEQGGGDGQDSDEEQGGEDGQGGGDRQEDPDERGLGNECGPHDLGGERDAVGRPADDEYTGEIGPDRRPNLNILFETVTRLPTKPFRQSYEPEDDQPDQPIHLWLELMRQLLLPTMPYVADCIARWLKYAAELAPRFNVLSRLKKPDALEEFIMLIFEGLKDGIGAFPGHHIELPEPRILPNMDPARRQEMARLYRQRQAEATGVTAAGGFSPERLEEFEQLTEGLTAFLRRPDIDPCLLPAIAETRVEMVAPVPPLDKEHFQPYAKQLATSITNSARASARGDVKKALRLDFATRLDKLGYVEPVDLQLSLSHQELAERVRCLLNNKIHDLFVTLPCHPPAERADTPHFVRDEIEQLVSQDQHSSAEDRLNLVDRIMDVIFYIIAVRDHLVAADQPTTIASLLGGGGNQLLPLLNWLKGDKKGIATNYEPTNLLLPSRLLYLHIRNGVIWREKCLEYINTWIRPVYQGYNPASARPFMDGIDLGSRQPPAEVTERSRQQKRDRYIKDALGVLELKMFKHVSKQGVCRLYEPHSRLQIEFSDKFIARYDTFWQDFCHIRGVSPDRRADFDGDLLDVLDWIFNTSDDKGERAEVFSGSSSWDGVNMHFAMLDLGRVKDNRLSRRKFADVFENVKGGVHPVDLARQVLSRHSSVLFDLNVHRRVAPNINHQHFTRGPDKKVRGKVRQADLDQVEWTPKLSFVENVNDRLSTISRNIGGREGTLPRRVQLTTTRGYVRLDRGLPPSIQTPDAARLETIRETLSGINNPTNEDVIKAINCEWTIVSINATSSTCLTFSTLAFDQQHRRVERVFFVDVDSFSIPARQSAAEIAARTTLLQHAEDDALGLFIKRMARLHRAQAEHDSMHESEMSRRRQSAVTRILDAVGLTKRNVNGSVARGSAERTMDELKYANLTSARPLKLLVTVGKRQKGHPSQLSTVLQDLIKRIENETRSQDVPLLTMRFDPSDASVRCGHTSCGDADMFFDGDEANGFAIQRSCVRPVEKDGQRVPGLYECGACREWWNESVLGAVNIRFIAVHTILFGQHPFHKLTEEELKTREADKLAFKVVGIACVPLLTGYTIYSLYYNEHRSWYSFVIMTLTMFVQAFGFVQMLPQLVNMA
ncbi:hypothetical protein ACM66B_002929 [Microbotryomycetes sp. NB124-2]